MLREGDAVTGSGNSEVGVSLGVAVAELALDLGRPPMLRNATSASRVIIANSVRSAEVAWVIPWGRNVVGDRLITAWRIVRVLCSSGDLST